MCVPRSSVVRECLAAIEAGGQEICLVVDEAEQVVGLLTDGDVRRALLAGADLDGTSAEDIMRDTFHWVSDGGNHRANALDAMRAHGLQQVPVLDEAGRLVGLHVIEEFLEATPLPNAAVILAGGRGERLRPLTQHVPKPMLRVAGRPILERLILGLVGHGVRRVYLSVRYKKEVIKDYFGDGAGHGCRIEYLEEEQPLGTGGPLALVPPQEHPLILLNGDLVGEFHFRALLEQHVAQKNAITMGVGLHAYEVPYGVVEVEDGRIRSITEKPRQSWWVNYGVYALSPEVVQLVPSNRHYPATDLVDACIARGWRVGAFELDGEWHDVGRPHDLAVATGQELPER